MFREFRKIIYFVFTNLINTITDVLYSNLFEFTWASFLALSLFLIIQNHTKRMKNVIKKLLNI